MPPPPDPETVFLPWGPSRADLARAWFTALQMSTDELAGQVIIARYSGTDSAGLVDLIATYHIGGVILGRGNIVSSSQVAALADAANAAAEADGRDWPFIVSTDQEGGTVARLDGIIPVMPSFMASGAADSKDPVRSAFAGMGRDMRTLGFTMDFAPVADLTIGLADPVIRSRSAGDDPQNVASTVIAAMDGLLDAGVVPAVKHFPGHGGVTSDTHLGAASTSESIESLEASDIWPFAVAIDAGAPVIMMSHISVAAWGGIPASIDPAAYAYVREQLGFTGVTVTDSMGMGALTPYGGSGALAVSALNAGADLILMPAITAEAHDAIVNAVNDGSLTRHRLEEAAARVIALMRYQASIDPQVDVTGDYVRALTAAAATVVAPLCGPAFVGSTVNISGGGAEERAALANALAAYGIAQSPSGTSVRLMGGPATTGSADVVVSMDGPWGLSQSSATVYIGLYGRGPSSLAALADVLAGQSPASGNWPVEMAGLPFEACPSPR